MTDWQGSIAEGHGNTSIGTYAFGPQDISLADARKAYVMFGKVDVPVLGLVENMSYFTAPGGQRVSVREVSGRATVYDSAGVRITAIPVPHANWRRAFGYRFETPDRGSVCIAGRSSLSGS